MKASSRGGLVASAMLASPKNSTQYPHEVLTLPALRAWLP